MSSLAEVLAWKFDGAEGIRTREDGRGGMEIFDWPDALGAVPSAAQIAQWTGQFNVRPPPSARFEDQAKAIEAATSLAELKAALAPLTRAL